MSDAITVYTLDDERESATLTVEKSVIYADRAAYVYTSDGVFLTAAEVDALRAALAPLGTKAEHAALKVGDVCRILPGARNTSGESEIAGTGATRVEIVAGLDSDGEYNVRALDGTRAGRDYFYVFPEYLAALAEPATVATSLADGTMTVYHTEPAPLDPRRVAALEKAAEETAKAGADSDGFGLLALARFLLDEEVDA